MVLTEPIDSLIIEIVEIDASPLNLISARPFSNYFDIRYSKPVTTYLIRSLNAKDSSRVATLNFKLSNEDKTIRIYNTLELTENDSLGLIVNTYDTLRQERIDTLYAKYNQSTSKPEDFTFTLNTPTPLIFLDTVDLTFQSNKPVSEEFLPDSIYLKFDSIYQQPIDITGINFNYSKTKVNFSFPLEWEIIKNEIISLLDTSMVDSATIASFELMKIEFILGKGSFRSIESDSATFKSVINKYNPEDYGMLRVLLNEYPTSFELQLIDSKFEVIQRVWNQPDHTFRKLNKGSYSLRILIDSNNDGYWSPGNILKDQPPEPIILYPEFIDLRPNFEITIEDFSF
jgi:hypothetical protein